MEIALPLIALGGMYIVSNQNNNKSIDKEYANSKDNFSNMGIRTNLATNQNSNYLPNTNIPPQNYPVKNTGQVNDTVQYFPSTNESTEMYLNQNAYEQRVIHDKPVGQSPQQIYSISGDTFTHNNMNQFSGGKVRGSIYNMSAHEPVLDNMNGSGSQIIHKQEIAPLFAPEDNMTWTHGMPNYSDFAQSRVIPSMKNNNVKPFDSIAVGPANIDPRSCCVPKSVDELRVATNPKLEYTMEGFEGAANSFIKTTPSIQTMGRVEKQRPDSYYENTPDRWFTTTGATTGPTVRSIQDAGNIRKNDNLINYTGPATANDLKVGIAPQNYEPSRRVEAFEGRVNHSNATGKGNYTDKDSLFKSYTNYNNKRSITNQPDTIRSGFSGAIGAVLAPVMDLLKPTRKSEAVDNIRVYGDIGGIVNKAPVYNPLDTAPTTIKETTLYEPRFNISGQKEGTYVNNYTSLDTTKRDTTNSEYFSSAGGYASGYGGMSYDAAYKQHNNEIKSQTIYNRPNQGGTQIYNQQVNNIHLRSDDDRFSGRVNPAFSKTSALPPSTQTYNLNVKHQQYDNSINIDRIDPSLLNAFKSNPYTHPLNST